MTSSGDGNIAKVNLVLLYTIFDLGDYNQNRNKR